MKGEKEMAKWNECEYLVYAGGFWTTRYECKKKDEIGMKDNSVCQDEYDRYCSNWKACKECP